MENLSENSDRTQKLVDDVMPSPRVFGIAVAVATGVLLEFYDMLSDRPANYWAILPLSALSGYIAYRFFRDRYEMLKSIVDDLLTLRGRSIGFKA